MSSEALPERAHELEEETEVPEPTSQPEKTGEKAKVIDLPGEMARRKSEEVKAEAPQGDAKTELGRVRAYDIIRFSRTGEVGWHDAEVVGWVDKDHLKLHIIDNGQKTARVMELHRSDIVKVDIIKGALDYSHKQ